jgi:hypothetical protein
MYFMIILWGGPQRIAAGIKFVLYSLSGSLILLLATDCVEVALRYPRVRQLIEHRDRVHDSTPLGWCCHGSGFAKGAGDFPAVARLLLDAGAKPGPNLEDAREDVLAVIREYGLAHRARDV